jgi:hypothetical protein
MVQKCTLIVILPSQDQVQKWQDCEGCPWSSHSCNARKLGHIYTVRWLFWGEGGNGLCFWSCHRVEPMVCCASCKELYQLQIHFDTLRCDVVSKWKSPESCFDGQACRQEGRFPTGGGVSTRLSAIRSAHVFRTSVMCQAQCQAQQGINLVQTLRNLQHEFSTIC